MTNPDKPPTRFGLETCEDMYEKLKWEAARLEEGWSTYDTFNFVVTANHLYVDWLRVCGRLDQTAKRDLLPAPAALVMQAIVDLSNGSKHWHMTHEKSLERQVTTKVHERIRGNWDAYLKSGPMIFVEFSDYILSMRALRDLVLGYFEWILAEGSNPFPAELSQQLEQCRIRAET